MHANDLSARNCGCDPGANHVCEWHSGLKQQMEEKAARINEHPLNVLARRVHAANKHWWVDLYTEEPIDRNVGEMLCLVHSEISEAMEGHRKNLMDDKLPERRMIEVELADAVIRILDICAGLGLDLGGSFESKMLYNASRLDHTREGRLAEGGKRY